MSSSFSEERETPEYENLAAIAEDVVFRLPGCTDVMIRKTIASVYRDFCKRTCCIKTMRTLTFGKGEWKKALAAKTSDCIVDCVVSVKMNGHELPRGKHWGVDGEWIVISGRLAPIDSYDVVLEVECVEIPKIGSEVAPSWFVQRYGDAITSGVLAQLTSMTGKPWSDANQAVLWMRNYENALTEGRVRSMDGGNLSAGELNYIKKGCVL